MAQTIDRVEDDADSIGDYERSPDGALRWPAPDRDSPHLGTFSGRFDPDEKINTLLQMDGHDGRSDQEVKRVTGIELRRARRWHKLFERIAILYPGEGVTRLGRLGRLLRDAAAENGLQRIITREVLRVLSRYQLDNPIEKKMPEGCDVHPYWAVLRAASKLDWRIHWDEVNRELMRITHDAEVDGVVDRIAQARADPGYIDFIGRESNAAGMLRERTHPAEASAPEGKTPEGQLRDQRMTPFLKRVAFGDLLLESPGAGGGGYWTVPPSLRDVVSDSVKSPPEGRRFSTEQEWVSWFCEGITAGSAALPPPPVVRPMTTVAELTLEKLRQSLDQFHKDLRFPDLLLASLVAAVRSGDGKNFVILRGISGTGKSRLAAAIASAVYGSQIVERPRFTIVEVRPDWTDGSALLGHYDPIAGRYIRTRFLDALLAANEYVAADPENPAPVFLCLDEMNIARVEYYLADCLSAIESGNPIPLDTRDDSTLPAEVRWPRNLFLFGTVNIDESTLRLSDKVLDRAQVIDTSDIDLASELTDLLASSKLLTELERNHVDAILLGVWRSLRVMNAHFGFRAARAMVRFIDEAKASSGGSMSIDDALDAQLVQKIFVKLKGEGDVWITTLGEIEETLRPLEGRATSKDTIRRMRADLERLGSFQFWH